MTSTDVRESIIRRATISLLALAVGFVLAGTACSPQDDGTATADALAAAIASHTVGDLTFDKPAAEVQKELTELADSIAPLWPAVSVTGVEMGEDNTARVSLDYSWAISALAKPWTYSTVADITRNGKAWTIAWTPEMVEPKLDAGDRFKLTATRGLRADILAADDAAIVKDRPVKIVGISKDGLSDAEAESGAKTLAAVVNIDPGTYAAKVKAYGPVAYVDAITLRAEDFAALDSAKLDAVAGILVTSATQPLAPSRTFAQAILGSVHEATAEDIEKSDGKVVSGQVVGVGGLQASFDAQLAGAPGITISAVTTAESSQDTDSTATDPMPPTKILYSVDPVDGKDVKTTLMTGLQSAAEDALAEFKTPSSIVVMRPSTGAILASANGPGSAGYNTAFLGQYAPGSTFKIATSLGLLRQGMTPSSTVNCAPAFTVDGKKFFNAPGYAAEASGEISLTSAVAHSCNTAFVSQVENLSQEKLADAAGALGIGSFHDLGLASFTGNVPRDSVGTEHAASMIGQGRVQVSPLGMAAMMSSVVKGSAVVPMLVDGHDGAAKPAEGAALTAKEAGELRTMMRAVVTDGYLDLLGELPAPEAIGKTGTAEYGNDSPPRTHSWVIAARGDIAVAVFVEDGDLGAVTGGPLAKTILEAAAGS